MPRLPASPPLHAISTRDLPAAVADIFGLLKGLTDYLDTLRQEIERGKIDVVLTADLAAAAAAQDGKLVVEDAGAGNRNLVLYGGGERFRVDGGAPV